MNFDFNTFKEIFDVPDVVLIIDNLSIPVGGVTITYRDCGEYFYKPPLRYEDYPVQDGSTMKYAKFSNKTADSVDVQILDINNNDVGGTIEKLIVEGY